MTQSIYIDLIERNFQWIKRKVCGDAAYKHGVDRTELFSLILERLWMSAHTFRPMPDIGAEESFRRWSVTMVYRMAIDMRRKKMLAPAFLELDVIHMAAHRYEMQVCDQSEEILKKIQAIYGDLAAISIRLLRHGYSQKECAALLDTNRTTIYRKLKRISEDIKKQNI